MQDPKDKWLGLIHIHLAITDPSGKGIFTDGDLNNIDPTYLFLEPDLTTWIKKAINLDPY